MDTIIGYYSKGDGGGGAFYWDSGSTAADNGGTVILPTGHTGAGRWKRIYSGSINVQWFGALPSAISHAAANPGIQKAIEAATSGRQPGDIYIPRGDYRIASPIIVPRLGQFNGLTIRGDGPTVTILSGDQLAEGTPVMRFEPVLKDENPPRDSYFFTLVGLQLSRDDGKGAVFNWSGTDAVRMIYAVFRDLLIDSPDKQCGPWTQQSPFSLNYCTDSSFENITLNGGESALRMTNCSRCTFNRLNVNLEDTSSGSGIVLNAVGTTTFRNTRIESPGSLAQPGYGIHIAGNSSLLVFDTIDMENHDTMLEEIAIVQGQEIVFINAGISAGSSSGKRGIHLYKDAHHIRFIGGTFQQMPNGTTIQIDSGASDIFFDDVRWDGSPLETTSLVSVSSDANRIRLNFVWGTNAGGWHSLCMNRNMIGTLAPAPSVSVAGYDIFRLRNAAIATAISSLTNGYDGQILTLLAPLEGLSLSLVNSGNINLTHSPYSFDSAVSTIRLVYDLTNAVWIEISRT